MIIAAFILIAAGILLFIFTPLFDPRDDAKTINQISRREARRRELIEQRDMVYEAIRELDFDHRMGKVEEDDYRQTRARYTAQAVELIKSLDKAAERTDRPASKPQGISDQIEKEIAAIRRTRKKRG
jgi:hypothetical protein